MDNKNNIPKITSKKYNYRREPEKTRRRNIADNGDNIDLFNNYGTSNNCSLNMTKDLNCGCGGLNEGCFIF